MARARAIVVIAPWFLACCTVTEQKQRNVSEARVTRDKGVATHRPEPAGARSAADAVESGFVPPDVRTRVRAAGNLAGLSDQLHAAFAPSTPQFTPLIAPLPGDWLADHFEAGQTFDQYRDARPNRPDKQRKIIYVLPIEPLGQHTPALGGMLAFARAHFGLDVELLEPVSLEQTGAGTRMRNYDAGPAELQANAADLLAYLKERVPLDAFCVIAITGVDLYPTEDWNFVFGMAKLRERVGVYSTARYHPAFYDEQDHYPSPERWVLRRSLKVMAHEIGHMFGIEHCIYYECVMNGTNHLEETDRRPVHLCPVCLRKLHYAVGFDPVERYRALSAVFRRQKLGPEAEWTRARAESLNSP